MRGRVTSDSGVAIPGADVVVTVVPRADVFSATTDSNGLYRVEIAQPTGEYVVLIRAIGRQLFRQRVTIAPGDSAAVVNARLPRVITQVPAVRVEARRARPSRSLGTEAGFGTDANDKTADGVSGAIPPDLLGNLDAMASLIPGLSVSPGAVSAFGLGGENNSALLNGLSFAGGDFPRDAVTTTRFRTSPWDPTIGGFSGVQSSTTLGPGGNVTRRRGHITLDAPPLQFTDAAASRAGQKYTNIALDEGGVGAYALDRFFYNFGIHAARQTSVVSSLADPDAVALARSGIVSDSVARVVALLSGLGIPLAGGTVPTQRVTSTVSFLERVDRAPVPSIGSGPPGSTLAFTGLGRYSTSDAMTLSPTVAPSFAGKTTNGSLGAQVLYSRYFGQAGDYVNETTSGFTLSHAHGVPDIALPTGTVLLDSHFPDGTTGIGSLNFGGNGALATDNRSWTWETINQTDWLMNAHQSLPFKLYLQSRFDGYREELGANRFGSFAYASLADLAANEPKSFTRTIDPANPFGGEWTGTAALGGTWIASALTLTGGLRADANAFTRAPADNAEVDRAFGTRTDQAPNGVSLSPRVGFVWKYTASSGFLSASTGNANFSKGLAQIRGGIGRFRGALSPTLLADALSNTGLDGAPRQLLCIGSAVPVPAWSTYADPSVIPNTCTGGTPTFADSARSVAFIDRGYRPSESWRANLGWTSSEFLKTYVAIDGTYSLNLHQPGTVDLNFSGVPRFTLPGEGNRPVYAASASIVPSTGAVSPVDSRESADFGRVTDRVSDLRGDARQITVYAIPNMRLNWGVVILGYTYAATRVQARGFDQSAAGDPRAVDWAPSPFTPRHQLILQASRFFRGGDVGSSLAFRVASGFRYTPLVSGDINGDGLANDRAFVFDPDAARDAPTAGGIRSLLTTGSGSARDCLSRQLGQVADRNSCTGPWSATMNANLAFYRVRHSDGRARVLVSLTNVLGGLDQLLHGQDRLHGWGSFPLPDPILYQVRGFDPATRQFAYDVNPRFGSTSPSTTTRRSPFRLSLDVQLDLGHSVLEQQVEQNMRLRPSLVGTRAPADTIKSRFMHAGSNGYSDLYAVLLRMTDSLALSRGQVEALRREQGVLRSRADSLFGELAAHLASLPHDFSVKDAARRVAENGDAIWSVVYGEASFLRATLSPGQIALLPSPVRDMVTVPNYRGRFLYGF
ncbi:MAG: carboxypeptidase regulatory-like domain-containing protein [Gemmatimonadaceae bacterium]